jgi:hypothetical protein
VSPRKRRRSKRQTKARRLGRVGPSERDTDTSKEWRGSRAGARAGRGFRYQDVVGAALLVSIWSGDRAQGRVVPEGWDDLVVEYEDNGHKYLQVKSRQPHVGAFSDREVARLLIDGWAQHERRLRQTGGEFVLVLERSLGELEPGEYRLAALEEANRLRAILAEKVGADRAEEMLQRSALLIWPDPESDAVDRLAAELHLPEAATLAHLNRLRSAIGEMADKNAAAAEEDRAGLSVTDVTVLIDQMTELFDREGLLEAITLGVCEAVDLLTPRRDDLFYTGVDVTPAHVAAGLTIERPMTVAAVERGLQERGGVLVAGPSGCGKSAVIWMAAYENRSCRWYRVKRLSNADDVASLARLARALCPSDRAPVGFVVDNVGQVGTEAWDSLVQELSMLPGTWALGAAREEDLFLIRTLPRLRVVRPQLTDELAEAIYAQLQARQQTVWRHWREPFEQSDGLLLEYVHLLTAGQRLEQVIGEQIRARRREHRDLELSILSVCGTATTWGAEVPLPALTTYLDQPDAVVSAALGRLVGEHLLQQRADGTIAGLHRLRSRAIYTAIHNHPPPTATASIVATIGLLTPVHLHSFLVGVLESPETTDDVIRAAASRLALEAEPKIAVAIFQALRTIEFRNIAQEWLGVFEEEDLPQAMRPLAAQMGLAGLDFKGASNLFDQRLVASLERLRALEGSSVNLRSQLLAALPRGWATRRLLTVGDCASAARLLATFEGLANTEPELRTVSDLVGSRLGDALVATDVREVAEVIAAARGVSVETALRLADAAGGVDALLTKLELATPWCRNLKTGPPTDELLDGHEVEGLSLRALVARVEYRYVADSAQQDIHGRTVDLARVVMDLHPELELVRAVAMDARERPHGVGDFEAANNWVKREALPTQDQVAWNRARMQLVESMLAAAHHTDRVAAELDLIERTAALLDAFGTIWLTGQGLRNVSTLDAERRKLLEGVDALPPAPLDIDMRPDPLALGPDIRRDAVQGLIRDCVGNLIPRLMRPDDNLAAVAAFIADKIANELAATTEPERWRLLGYNETPGAVAGFAGVIRDLGAVVSEVAFGGASLSELRARTHTIGRARKLRAAAEVSRSRALLRFNEDCRRVAEASERACVKVEVLARPASNGGVTWPPVEVLFLVHVDRLDQWALALGALAAARSHLSDTHQVAAVPVREGVAIPLLGCRVLPEERVVLPDRIYPWDENAWEEWQPGYPHLGHGASLAFRQVLASVVAVSSISALPGGLRPGPESEVAEKLKATASEELHSLESAAAEHPDGALLQEAVTVARVLVEQAHQELESADVDFGGLARWALNMVEGVQDDLARTVDGLTLLLTEWDIAPHSAAQWYSELLSA